MNANTDQAVVFKSALITAATAAVAVPSQGVGISELVNKVAFDDGPKS